MPSDGEVVLQSCIPVGSAIDRVVPRRLSWSRVGGYAPSTNRLTTPSIESFLVAASVSFDSNFLLFAADPKD